MLSAAILLAGLVDSQASGKDDSEAGHRHLCNYVTEHAGLENFFRDRLVRFGVFDANNDGYPETVDQDWEKTGTARGDVFRLRTPDGKTITIETDPSEKHLGQVGWSFGAGWLPFKNHWYLLSFREEAARFVLAASYLSSENRLRVVCRFENEVTERIWSPSRGEQNQRFCNDLLEHRDASAVKFERPTQISVDTLGRVSPGARHVPEAQRILDFDNDGLPDTILRISVSSGAGRGCDATYYDLLDDTGTRILEGEKRDLLLRLQQVNIDDAFPHRRCTGVSQWITRDGGVAFEIKYPQKAPARGRDLYHEGWAISQGVIEKICESTFTINVHMDDAPRQ